jgi:hypothetical protein
MEGTREYIERAVADSRQKVTLQLGGCEGAHNPPPPSHRTVGERGVATDNGYPRTTCS